MYMIAHYGSEPFILCCSLVPRPSPSPVYDRLQYAKMELQAIKICWQERPGTKAMYMYVTLNYYSLMPNPILLVSRVNGLGTRLLHKPSVTIQYSVFSSKLWLRYLQHSGYDKAI